MSNGRPASPVRVLLLCGGRSPEHEVSIASATSVLAVADPTRLEMIPVVITKQGRWLLPAESKRALANGRAEGGGGSPPSDLERLAGPLLKDGGADVVFPLLHGPFGEDGTVQGLLELADAAYVGSGVLGSALAMDKLAMKAALRASGLPIVAHIGVSRAEWIRDPAGIEARAAELGFPLFTKPANMGSSLGIVKVKSPEELRSGLDEAFRYDRRALIEAAAVGARELEVAVLGNDHPSASCVGEIVFANEFYDYEAKYTDGLSRMLIPADVPEDLAELAREYSRRAFRAVDAAGLARVDLFYLPARAELLVNEINTMPGFTRFSMYPSLWAASGLPYPKLIERLVELALERHADRNHHQARSHPTT